MSNHSKYNQSKEPKKFNLRIDGQDKLIIDPASIPNQVPKEDLDVFMNGDKDPYFKVQKIDYPIIANGYNYVEPFFKSFTSKLNFRMIPGSKEGHKMSYDGRPSNDLFLVGSKFESNGDGTGSVYFKNYIPKTIGDKDNSAFILENKANLIEYSLVSYTKDERIENGDGSVSWNVVQSMMGERNDAVDIGAMSQKLNGKQVEESTKNIQGEVMDKKKEALDTLKNFKLNGEINLLEIAKYLSLENQVVTDELKAKANSFDEVAKMCGDKTPKDFINDIEKERKENAVEVRKAKMNELFGEETITGSEKQNMARVYANEVIGNSELTEEKVNSVLDSPIFKKFNADLADVDSDVNTIGVIDGKKENKADNKPKVQEY
jgi:hypothetical protein